MDSSCSKEPLTISEQERDELMRWIRLPSTSQAVVLRCRIILACARGRTNAAVARELGVSPQSVGKWRTRFRQGRLTALRDLPRSGAPRTLSDDRVQAVLEAVLTERPPNGSRWTKRSLADRAGVSPSSVMRVLHRMGITIDRTTADSSEGRERDQWGALYVSPPESIMAVAVDESDDPENGAGRVFSPVPGNEESALRAELATQLSRRSGSDSSGDLIGFLRSLEHRAFGPHDIHLICHGHGTRKIEAIRRWQEQHTRLHLHFTPSKELWIRLVERYFAPLRPGRASGTPLSLLADAVRGRSGGRAQRRVLTWFHPA
ncbi:transposase [Actinopolyspora biskrensis]|uniref:Transposase n=1 Tax=Actinopolyspora biskrensis TaxID=1470178 RepID=A0A852YUV1_9ACTN|nr:helix-turn-helix domain-containing protein [Actinopolyspora biskrensis]NYH77840.1 transposase [Actinopolyspora biskrensis]